MKFKMAQNSIFAILLRSSWWVSAAIAAVLLAGSQAASQPLLVTCLMAAALPFIVIAGMAAWKQRSMPSATRVEETAAAVRAMSWPVFKDVLHQGFREDGCEVSNLKGEHADFELRRKNRLAVVSARRWKASRVGVQALEDLNRVRQARDAQEAIYVTIGEVSEQAAAYARAHQIQFMSERELARLLPRESLASR